MNEDILYLNRPVSKYPKMNIQDRASIFSPFAALTGYEDAIKETGKLLDKKVELDENEIEIINYKLQNIKNKEISIKYFVKDYLSIYNNEENQDFNFWKELYKRLEDIR